LAVAEVRSESGPFFLISISRLFAGAEKAEEPSPPSAEEEELEPEDIPAVVAAGAAAGADLA